MRDVKVAILLAALALDEEDNQLTLQAYNSYMACPTSFVKEIVVDPRLHKKGDALSLKWNQFIQHYRDYRESDYDYLVICANDTIAHPQAFEHLIRVMEDNPDIGIMHPVLNRDRADFDLSCQSDIEYTPDIFFSPHETAQMFLRKGVIEQVGDFDLMFPHERGEQDYFLRAHKMGIELATSPMKLFYHPPYSQSDPNRQGLTTADKNFEDKFGTNWFSGLLGEGYEHPYNDPTKDWTTTLQSRA